MSDKITKIILALLIGVVVYYVFAGSQFVWLATIAAVGIAGWYMLYKMDKPIGLFGSNGNGSKTNGSTFVDSGMMV
jgi:hypothetical protein